MSSKKETPNNDDDTLLGDTRLSSTSDSTDIDNISSSVSKDKDDKTFVPIPSFDQMILDEIEEMFAKDVNIETPERAAARLLRRLLYQIVQHNSDPDTGKRRRTEFCWPTVHVLPPIAIAHLAMHFYKICVVVPSQDSSFDSSLGLLSIYQTDGSSKGLYVSDSNLISSMIIRFNNTINAKDESLVIQRLQNLAPKRCRTMNPDLVPVKNGVFRYSTKELQPFDPQWVFMSKINVDYRPDATSPIIDTPDGDSWDVESWMSELSDDTGVPQLLWQVVGASIRPFVPWNKSVWLYSSTGANGKGTLVTLIRNLIGQASVASIPLNKLDDRFEMSKLKRATAIIADENPVGTFIDQTQTLKALVTGDVITMERKYFDPIPFVFRGLVIQCINEMPRTKDRSESLYRRYLLIPMNKRFADKERKYIKEEYMYRQDVLEYVLKHVLLDMPDFYEFDQPQVVLDLLDEYKQANDPLRQFFAEIMENASWDLLPWTFLYPLYINWLKATNPQGKPIGRNLFIREISLLTSTNDSKFIPARKVRSKGYMDCPEPLIAQYRVQGWMKADYRGNDPMVISSPALRASYQGLLRKDAYNKLVNQKED